MPEGGGLSVRYQELGVREGDSPAASLDTETMATTRRLIVDWADIQTAMQQLIGFSYLDANNKLHRYLPQRDWEYKGLWAGKVTRTQGLGWKQLYTAEYGAGNSFKKASLDVTFLPRPYRLLDDAELASVGGNEFLRYVEIETTSDASYLSLPQNGELKWSEPPGRDVATKPFPGNVGIIVGALTYTLRWHQIPDLGLPVDTIIGTIGHVNKTDFGDPSNFRYFFPKGTALVLGAGWRKVHMFTPDGLQPGWNVEYQVKYAPHGHNRFYDFKCLVSGVKTPGWYQVTSDGVAYPDGSIPDTKCVFDEIEFKYLFDTTQN
jgi:hypothetical protein